MKKIFFKHLFLLLLGICASCNELYQPEDSGISPLTVKDYGIYLEHFMEKYLPPEGNTYPPTDFIFSDDYGDELLVINNMEDFQNAISISDHLPSIDFDEYTLLVGRASLGHPMHDFVKQSIYIEQNSTVLKVFYEVPEGNFATTNIVTNFYFWGLYPKLPEGSINLTVEVI